MIPPLKLVLLRHGQSVWNKQRRLSGWADIGLTAAGERQAVNAGKLLLDAGFEFDEAYTSELCRATDTLSIVLDTMRRRELPVHAHWRLNERHYGALEGLGPVSAVWKFGLRQAFQCQRHYDVSPPLLRLDDPRFPGNQARYAAVPPEELPRAESMAQAAQRVRPIWEERIAPALQAGRRLLVVAHKNSLRVLIKQIGGYSAAEVERLAIRTGKPVVYELNAEMEPIRDYVVDGKTPK